MTDYLSLYTQYMDEHNIRYTVVGAHEVAVNYRGNRVSPISVHVFFDPDGEPLITLKCWSFLTQGLYQGDASIGGIITCHTVNSLYRWVKFYVDDNGDAVAQTDAYVTNPDSCGWRCNQLALRMVNIIDDSFRRFLGRL